MDQLLHPFRTLTSSQPLQQRGILLYCMGRHEAAAAQLAGDVLKLEKMRVCKAAELRLWHCAALRQLGR